MRLADSPRALAAFEYDVLEICFCSNVLYCCPSVLHKWAHSVALSLMLDRRHRRRGWLQPLVLPNAGLHCRLRDTKCVAAVSVH